MRFALINNERVEAAPKLKGQCPGCLQPVRARCGLQRVRHWAHVSKEVCNSWREKETEWHRTWKSNFPTQCQEFIQYDEKTGEKHIADVRTNHGLVIEFQHSFLKLEERASREGFHKNMIWVVNGARLKRDYPRFMKGRKYSSRSGEGKPFLLAYPDECFPSNWLESRVPVVFDFRAATPADLSDTTHELLWWLLPGRIGGSAIVQAMSYNDFIATVSNHPALNQVILRIFNEFAVQEQRQRARQKMELAMIEMARRKYYRPRRRFRRF